MKRISIAAAIVLMGATGLTKAYSSLWERDEWNYRVHWSVYTHSLIPGDLYYSPYAYGYGRSGLVPYWVRYSPYAFGVDHPSGLVNDLASSPISLSSIYYEPASYGYRTRGWNTYECREAYHAGYEVSKAEQKQARYAANVQARRDRIRQRQEARQEGRVTAGSGGSQVIAAYLKSKNIDFTTNRILQIGGKTISVDFLLTDQHILVKYWDPVEILALDQQAEYRKRAYESYLESWKNFGGQYQHAGGTIYQVISADSDEILAKLTDCSAIDGQARTYALAQDNTAVAQQQ